MEQIKRMVKEVIGGTSKKALAEELNISYNTLMSRIEKGGWMYSELEIIERLASA